MQAKTISSKKGLTIIEVIVVIGIIAILTTIAYTSLSQIRAKSRDQKRIADIHSIQLALEYYFNKNARYPEMVWPKDMSNELQKEDSLYSYLDSEPKAPSKDEIYYYIPLKTSSTVSRCSSYHLYTTLELKTSALDSKRNFNSLDKVICGSFAEDGWKIDASATENDLVYDLRP